MKHFVVARMLGKHGISVARTESFGSVDIRAPNRDTPAEREALRISCSKFGEDPDDTFAMRIVTVVEADDAYSADAMAEERLEEVANIRSSQTANLSTIRLMQAGYIRPIGATIVPREPPRRRSPGIHFRFSTTVFEPVDLGRWLFAQDRSDLAQRLVRSYHWSHRAQLEHNLQLRILFRWFAMETIWTLGKEDDVLPRILWALGIPNGRGLAIMTPHRLDRLILNRRQFVRLGTEPLP